MTNTRVLDPSAAAEYERTSAVVSTRVILLSLCVRLSVSLSLPFWCFAFCYVLRKQVLELPAAAEPLRLSQAGEGKRGRRVHAPVVREGEARAAQPSQERLLP